MNIIKSLPFGAALVALTIAAAPMNAVAQMPAAPALPAAPAVQAPIAAPAVAFEADPASLDPGEFVWQPERATSGAVEVVVSIPQQIVYVYRGGTMIGVSTVSTGRPGHRTPTGSFQILEKARMHHSNRYNNAPMPFMQRLTMDGIALHAGELPGHPASHGCVRLPLAFARDLFSVTAVGATVRIINAAPTVTTALDVARSNGSGLVRLASAMR